MASPVEQSIQEAKAELEHLKQEKGVEVNTPEKSIVRKAVSSVDEEMDPDEGLENGNDLDAELERLKDQVETETETGATVPESAEEIGQETGKNEPEPVKKERESRSRGLVDRIKSSLGLGTGEEEKKDSGSPTLELEENILADDTVPDLNEDTLETETGEKEPETPVSPEPSGDSMDPVEAESHGNDGNNLEGEIVDSVTGLPHETRSGEKGGKTSGRDESKVSREEPAGEELDVSEGDAFRRQLRDLQEKIVEEEAEELSKISELENRVESLELENDNDVERRIERLENQLERMKTPEQMEDRMSELEEVIMQPGNHLDKLVDEETREKLEKVDRFDRDRKKMEAEIERLGKEQEELLSTVREMRGTMEQLDHQDRNQGDADEKVERLWEAMDEELASIEDRIYDNETEVDDLTSDLLELSELVKKALHQ